eukprot:XP_028356706.1 dual specificity protein phosphatase 8-like [Physeter catodon]
MRALNFYKLKKRGRHGRLGIRPREGVHRAVNNYAPPPAPGGRPHDVTEAPPLRSEFGPGVHFIPVLIPNILSIVRAVPRRPSRAEPLQPPPRPRRPPRAPTKHFADSLPPCGPVRAAGPGLGAAASGDRPCSEAPPPRPPLPGAAGSSPVRPAGPGAGAVLGGGGGGPARGPGAGLRAEGGGSGAEVCLGLAGRCGSSLRRDERRHGGLCRFSRTVAAAAAASLHIQVENFQESAETLCPKKTESQLPPNPGGDSPWKTSLRSPWISCQVSLDVDSRRTPEAEAVAKKSQTYGLRQMIEIQESNQQANYKEDIYLLFEDLAVQLCFLGVMIRRQDGTFGNLVALTKVCNVNSHFALYLRTHAHTRNTLRHS